MAKSIYVLNSEGVQEVPMHFDDYQSEVRIRMEQDIIPNMFFKDPKWFISELENRKDFIYQLVCVGYKMGDMETYYKRNEFNVKKKTLPGGEDVYVLRLPKPEWSYESTHLWLYQSVFGLHVWFFTKRGVWWMDRYPSGTIERNPKILSE